MTNIGFIGLGLMGDAMVGRLLNFGHNVTVWNRTREKIFPSVERGAIEASSIIELASSAEFILMCLTDADAVEAVVFGEDGIATVASKDKILVDFSSIRPDVTKALAVRLRSETGMGWIDAPVSGGVKGAKEGTLAIMAGGNELEIERVRPVVSTLSQRFTRMGENGAGQVTKLCNQIIVASNIATIAEAVNFAEKSGVVDASKLAGALKGGWADSQPFQIMAPRFAARNNNPMIGASNTMLKDLNAVRDVAFEHGAKTPMVGLAHQALQKLSDMGLGDEDIGEIMKLYDNFE